MQAGLRTDYWKTSLEDYLLSACYLFGEIKKRGFSPKFPIPIDPYGELLNGSHRVALAVALDVKVIPVIHEKRHVWAPAWNFDWFVKNGMLKHDLDMLEEDLEKMNAQSRRVQD